MKKKYSIIVILAAAVIAVVMIVGIPSVMDYQAKHRVYSDMEAQLAEVKNANILIVPVEISENSIGYGAGASGVIIDRSGDTYFALTAHHVIDHNEIDHFVIITPEDPSAFEYKKEHQGSGLTEYYDHLPRAQIVHKAEESDLAVISFQSDKQLSVVPVSEKTAAKGDRVAVISNPEGEKFVSTFGKVISSEPEEYDFRDDHTSNLVLKHNAYEAPGSSGSAVYNEKMELTGINIGGGRDLFGRFRHGVMIPSDQITDCLRKWNAK